jgi:aryl-alcohol dehydrogenase-like predicted oxidoreductase
MLPGMEYRRMGRSGLKLSALSFGSWVTYGNQMDTDLALSCMKAAREYGVNFFDNAEVYAKGKSETIMGACLRTLGWRRGSYVVSTKLFWGLHDSPNEKNTLNRKYLLEAMDGSLERFGLSHVDLVYCHRPDAETPIEETVQAMHDLVARGKAHYWGTSEWSAEEFRAAWDFADRWRLHRPVVEQPQYNLLHRDRVEVEYAPLYADSAWARPSGRRSRRGCSRASTTTASPRAAAARCRATSGCGVCSPTPSASRSCVASARWPRRSASPWRSSPSRGA